MNINCPEGSHSEIERWGGVGENGWLKSCKMKHGAFTVWRGEVKTIQGSYINGEKAGVWEFWNTDGHKYKEVTFENGKEINVQEF